MITTIDKILRKRDGVSFVSATIAFVILGLGIGGLLVQLNLSNKGVKSSAQSVVATAFATELLETLRMHSRTALVSYLSVNPANPSSPVPFMCAHMNILDRTTGNIINRDGMAALPVNSLDGTTSALKSNRYYQITVIDIATMQMVASYCQLRMNALPALAPTERVMVTVGVSWVAPGKLASEAESVSLASVLP